jgi:hypothetical protein
MLSRSGFEVVRHRFCMFRISRRTMLFTMWWERHTKTPLPSLFLLPLYYERAVSRSWGRDRLPYDVIVEARKPPHA